jgi:hypothetical protein
MTDNNARGTLINQVGAVFVPVADQNRALGFEKRADFTYGEDSRWMEIAPPGAANTLADSSVAEGPRTLQSCGVSLPGLSVSNTISRE